jgi:hypothetical protein
MENGNSEGNIELAAKSVRERHYWQLHFVFGTDLILNEAQMLSLTAWGGVQLLGHITGEGGVESE